jgi:hypothetical protein
MVKKRGELKGREEVATSVGSAQWIEFTPRPKQHMPADEGDHAVEQHENPQAESIPFAWVDRHL